MRKSVRPVAVVAILLGLSLAARGAGLASAPASQGPQYVSYDYQETTENMVKDVRLTIPEGLDTVRGLLVVTNPSGNDTRDWHRQSGYRAFMALHGFAFLGARGFTSHVESFQVMQHALEKIAREAHHPELVNVPYATTGFSAGGGFASRLLVEAPERVIACVPVSSRINFTGTTPSAANLATPALVISGEKESLAPVGGVSLEDCRDKGALYGWMTVQGGGHAMMGQEVLALPYLDTLVRLRYPADADVRKGPVKLKDLDASGGWVADMTSWKSGLTAIAAAKDFHGEAGKTSWLPTEDLAFIYRAYATYDRLLTLTLQLGSGPAVLTPPAVGSAKAGTDVTLLVDTAKFGDWKKLAFYDGAHCLGEITADPPQGVATKLTAGYHVFSLLGTDGRGNVRTSNPMLVVVAPPPADGGAEVKSHP